MRLVAASTKRIASSGVRLALFLVALIALPAITRGGSSPSIHPGTANMAALLDDLSRKSQPAKNPFLSRERAVRIHALLSSAAMDQEREFELRLQLAREWLNAGEIADASAEFTRCLALVRKGLSGYDSRWITQIQFYLAVCHLRQGELDNCIALHGPDSCLLPLGPAAVHQNQRGSRAAIEVLSQLLARNPANHPARWLLNLAYMTVGEYPDKVPAASLIPPAAFASDYPLPRFRNVADAAGVAQEGLAGGTVADDFDNDGDLDLLVSEWGMTDQLRYYRNKGDGTFTEQTEQAGLTGLVGGLNMVQADYDNDGAIDVFVLRGAWLGSEGRHPNSLLRNRGDGSFEDVTEQAGVLSFHPTQTATWFDYNNDGWIDLFVGNESAGQEQHPCELFRNNGNGTFTECAKEAGIDVLGFVKGVTSGDYDNDGRIDLYLSLLGEPNLLFHNEGPVSSESGRVWRFRNATAQAGVSEPVFSFPTWFFDYDNDGWQDLFVSGYRIWNVGDFVADYLQLPHSAEPPRLYRNNGNGTFSNVTKQANLDTILLTMGCNFGDLDHDGYLDFYIGTGDPEISTIIPNRMFRNDAGKQFQDVTTSGGFGHLQKGHAISFADFDLDGDQDVYTSLGGAYPSDVYRNALFQNPGTTNHWIGLKLEGTESNRAAIGARIKLTVKTAEGYRHIYKTVSSGGSFGANPLQQQIGLGTAPTADLELQWPATGKTQKITGLKAGRFYHLRENEPNPSSITTAAKPHRSAAKGLFKN